jgi:transposase
MAPNFVRGDDPGQAYLMPPDPRDWLPARHLAWELRDLTARMDLAPFTGWYRADGQGRPAYHPAVMVALIGYCYCKGIRSSRAIEAATFDDVGARVICGNLHPDHSTIARFISRHEAAVKGLLVASVVACAREGLVTVDVVAGDGTKVRASASMAANATLEDLGTEIAELEALVAAEVDAWVAQARAEDLAQGTLDGSEGRARGEDGGQAKGEDGPRGAGRARRARRGGKRAAATLARRQQARAMLEASEQARREQAEAERSAQVARLAERAASGKARAEAEAQAADAKVAEYQARAAAKAAAGSGKRPDGRVPVSAAESGVVRKARQAAGKAAGKLAAAQARPAGPPKPGKINTTDPGSQVMQAKNGGYGQLRNVQALAGKGQVIYALTTHPSPADVHALHPLLAAGRATLDAAGVTGKLGIVLFDAGYASDANFTAACEGDLHVAVTKEARQTGRLSDGKQPRSALESWQQMTARLATPQGAAAYKQRAGIIEPVFAQLFSRLGRHLNYRDAKADLELALWATTHNLLKAIRARQRRQATTAPALAAA